MKFPDFVIIGAMKSGTTVLWHNLNKHPEINMAKNPEDPKIASTEIRFWNNGVPYRTWNRGIDWYRNLFSGSCCGEKCANYIEERSTMERMARHIPDVKLILCLRNPVDRAYSEYQMQRKGINKPFDMSLADARGYLYRGSYYNQIANHVLPLFPRNNLYVITQEEMKADTNGIVNKLYDFLGTAQCDLDVVETTQEIASDRNLDLDKDGQIKEYKVWSAEYEPMSDEVRSALSVFYKSHNEKLFDLLGYEIKEWTE